MRIVVLGGTGLTGPFAVRGLERLGHQVTVFHRGLNAADFPAGIRVMQGDFDSPPVQLRDPSPDLVIHMWAMTQQAANSFVEFFRGSAGRTLVISSGDVYRAYGHLQRLESGEPGAIPIAEDAPLRQTLYPYRDKLAPDSPDWMRHYDKLLVERAVSACPDLPTTILRYPAVYGPGDAYHRFRPWLQQMAAGDEVRLQPSYANWRWTHGYAENVAEAVVAAVANPPAANRVYNVGEAHTPTVAARIEDLGRTAGWHGRVVAASVEAPPLDFAHHLVIDTTRIRQELDFKEPITPEEALVRTIAWESDNPTEG